jgi:hypothetical protein
MGSGEGLCSSSVGVLGAVPPEKFLKLTGLDAILAYCHAIFTHFVQCDE